MLQASLQKLNKKLEGAAVPMERFRPNLVVAGTEAWEEDDWESFTVSGHGHAPCKFSATMPCDRCKARWSMTIVHLAPQYCLTLEFLAGCPVL